MKEFLDLIAYKCDSDIPDDDGIIYRSRQDDSYVGREGQAESDGLVRFWKDHGVKELFSKGGKVACIGFSATENKWYGWSHRAIYGFEVGSEVKKGDCGYGPTDKDDFLDDCVRFWTDDNQETSGAHTKNDGEEGVYVSWLYSDSIPNESIRGTLGGTFRPYPDTYGKGEWKAETIEDAKQMAIDFASSVS